MPTDPSQADREKRLKENSLFKHCSQSYLLKALSVGEAGVRLMTSCITGVNYTVLRFTVLTGRLQLGTKFDVSNQNSVCRRESGTISGKASTPILLIYFQQARVLVVKPEFDPKDPRGGRDSHIPSSSPLP